MKSTRRAFLAGSAGLASLATTQANANAAGLAAYRRPNIVILFADDAGYGDLSCYGHPTIHTPHIDRLAAQGTRFTSFVGPPACTPSRAALLTGRYPVRPGGVANVIGPDSEVGLPAREVTIATALRAAGYRTKCVGKWHLGHARDEFMPTSHGFDSYFGLLYSNDMIPPWVQTDMPLRFYRDLEALDGAVDQTTLTVRYTDEATRFIQECAGKDPFFLYLPYSMPHLPLAVADRFRGISRAGLYGDVMTALDWSAGQIMAALEAAGVADDTLVIWTSDNGPWINMPDRMIQPGPDGLDNLPWHAGSPGPFRDAKGTTYEGGARVPAIFRWPGRVQPGIVEPEPANSMDILPTVLDAAGVSVPQDRIIDGNSLLPLLHGDTKASPSQTFFYFRADRLEAVRQGPWKLQQVSGEDELFHLDRDIGERFNLAAAMPEKVTELRALLQPMAAETGTQLLA